MSPRIALTLLLMAAAAMGQAPPATTPGAPPEVDQVLRARVDEFFRYHVEATGPSLRKAMEMVAEETKDEYFTSGKPQLLKFEISGIQYSEEFTRARVSLEVSRNLVVAARIVEFTQPMNTTWKIEGGKWMWYQSRSDLRATPMSDLPGGQSPTAAASRPTLPPELSEAGGLEALARSLLRPSTLDKQSVTLRWGQTSEDQVIFLNEYAGAELELASTSQLDGFSVAADKATLGAKENGLIRFRYTPPAEFDATEPAPMPFFVELAVIPFNQVLRIQVRFATP